MMLVVMQLTALGQARTDSLLNDLTTAIGRAPECDGAKLQRIGRLQSLLQQDTAAAGAGLSGTTIAARKLFAVYEKLYEEYQIFNYDSAYQYAGKMQAIARRLGDPTLITTARLKLCFILLSSGLFRETYDSLRTTDIRQAPDSLKAVYYTLLGRYYYDLANYDYDGNEHSADYDQKGSLSMDSALTCYPEATFEYAYYHGLLDFKRNNDTEATSYFVKLLDSSGLTDHQLALTASTLSGVYLKNGRQ